MSTSHKSVRPLSPHLQVYKPQLTSVTSILNRITGFALSIGLFLLCWWLWAAAYSPGSLKSFYGFTGSWFGILLLFGWSVAFYYHLANGIRHLIWDTGRMLELKDAYKGGYAVLGFTFGAVLGTWIYIGLELAS
jgi:succinate dehydrogenase / fumarate reductase cytochrome b subunit